VLEVPSDNYGDVLSNSTSDCCKTLLCLYRQFQINECWQCYNKPTELPPVASSFWTFLLKFKVHIYFLVVFFLKIVFRIFDVDYHYWSGEKGTVSVM